MTVIIPKTGPKRVCALCQRKFIIPIIKHRVKGTRKYKTSYSRRKYCDKVCENAVHSDNRMVQMKTFSPEQLAVWIKTPEQLNEMRKVRWNKYHAATRYT